MVDLVDFCTRAGCARDEETRDSVFGETGGAFSTIACLLTETIRRGFGWIGGRFLMALANGEELVVRVSVVIITLVLYFTVEGAIIRGNQDVLERNCFGCRTVGDVAL